MPIIPLRPAEYSGVPSVEPTSAGPGPMRVDAPISAFGGAMASAMEKLGKGSTDLGNDLYERAQSMQQLKNSTDAQNLVLAASEQLGQARADYLSKMGTDAVDGLPTYQGQVKAIHAATVDSAANPMLKVMVGRELTSRVSRDLDYAGMHAATELKRSAVGTSQATIASAGDEALRAPYVGNDFAASLDKVEAETRHQGELQGWTPEITAQKVQEERSKFTAKNILGLSRVQPYQADTLRKQAIASGDLRGEDIGKVTNVVQNAMHTVGARNISHNINTGSDLHFGSGMVTMGQAKAAIGEYESGNNYNNVGPQTKHGKALGKYQVMEENLPEFLAKAGLPNMTSAQFLANHDAQEKVFEANFGAAMKKYGNFNDAASVWFSGQPVSKAGGVKDAFGTTVPTYLAKTNAILARGAPLADKVAHARDLAAQQSPDDPLFQDYTQARVEADYNQQRRIKMDDEYNNKQVIENVLMGDPQTGKLPTTVEEIKHSSAEAEAAWNALPSDKQRRYLNVMTHNAKGDFGWTEAGLRRYQTLKGQAQDDPSAFLEHDVVSEKLPWSARRELVNLQGRLKAKAESDPNVTKAMTALAPDLYNAGVTKAQDPDSYYQFVGTLQDALYDFQKENNRQPKGKEVQEIGARLLQEHSVGYFDRQLKEGGWGKERTFHIPVPDRDAELIKSNPMWAQLGITPTDQQVQRVYARGLYQHFYGGKTQEANQ